MCRTSLLVFFIPVFASAQDCLLYDHTVTIEGTLEQRNNNGYRKWIALRPEQPICTIANPNNGFQHRAESVAELQTSVSGKNLDTMLERLRRMVGHAVRVEGKLDAAHTGYHLTEVMIDLTRIDPLDAAGEAALRAPKQARPIARRVSGYDIVIHAGRTLVKEAREHGSNKLLTPIDDFAPHWVTGGEVVYVNCREGYQIESHSSIPEYAAMCGDMENTCDFNRPEKETITLRMRCVKQKGNPR